MIFPNAPDAQPRHPSQLYEAASEGLILFIVLAALAQIPAVRNRNGLADRRIPDRLLRSRDRPCELFREPDAYLGFIVGGISMGQILCIPMALAGAAFIAYALRRPPLAMAHSAPV